MQRSLYLLCLVFLTATAFAQDVNYKSIHQEELEKYNALGFSYDEYYEINKPRQVARAKSNQACNLNKVVFGWHPYWSAGLEANYDWNLLSDLSFFSYEVVSSTGQASTTHGWSTSTVIDEALANGVRVNLCVTLFSDHATFFASSTAQQTLISNLISLVQTRGAHGVNIDFEGVSSSLKSQFSAFLIDLCTQMHSAIPGSQVSVCTYAVDWSDLFDEPAIDPYIDYYTIMGYAYYYSGSSTAGPTAPLYTFSSYNYNLSRTVNYYINQGASREKIVLGLPYYGHEWNTTSSTIPSSTTSSVSSRTYRYVKDNTTGNYSTRQWDSNSMTPYYVYNSGNWRQCFCDDEISLGRRYDLVNMQGIAGIGIWALGYDDGYTELWDLLREKFTDCGTVICSDTIYDMGGPNRVYFDDDDYTFTIAPTGASRVNLDFIDFDIEPGSSSVCNYDYLEIFDGPTSASPSLGKFCNTTGSPGSIMSTGGALTLNFHSDGATTNNGYYAIWTCIQDSEIPVTEVNAGVWQSDDFTANFTDSDNESVAERYYQVLDWDSNEWRANGDYGFINDNFTNAIHGDWASASGSWSINAAHLNQTNEDSSNTNLYIPLIQTSPETYMYHWQMSIGGSGANRRAGLHFYCDDPSLLQRGNSYMVYFRVDQDKCQIYKSVDNVIDIYTDDAVVIDADTWYDYKIIFNSSTGEIRAFQNNVLVSSWTDPSPHSGGAYLSLRTGNCNVLYDDVKVYRSRTDNALVTVGSNAEVRYQNPDPLTPSCRIKSMVIDAAGNFSVASGTDVNIDWTAPSDIQPVNDGLSSDIDTVYTAGELSANWGVATEPNSDVIYYDYSITDESASVIVPWTNNGSSTSVTQTGLSLVSGIKYYFNIRAINTVDLISDTFTSDGQVYIDLTALPAANFSVNTNTVCEGSPVQFLNGSQNSDQYHWTFENGNPPNSTESNPAVVFPAGTFDVQLIAFSGTESDTMLQAVSVTIEPLPVASFSSSQTEVPLPPGIAYFTNASEFSTTYLWDFGDGTTSSDFAPWHMYSATGYYSISLVATDDICGSDTLTLLNYIHVFDPVGVNSHRMNTFNFEVYPNPVSDFAWINVSTANSNIQVRVFDAVGHDCSASIALVKEDQRIFVDFSAVESGVYYIALQDAEAGFGVNKIAVVK